MQHQSVQGNPPPPAATWFSSFSPRNLEQALACTGPSRLAVQRPQPGGSRCRTGTSAPRWQQRPTPGPSSRPPCSSRFLWICHSSSASPCCSSPSPSLQVQPLPSACFGETLTAAALSFQHPRSCPTLPPAQSLPHLSIPQGRGDSVNTQGT